MLMNDGQPDPTTADHSKPAPVSYRAPRATPVFAATALTLVAGALLAASIVGFFRPIDGEDAERGTTRMLAAVLLGVGSLAFMLWSANRVRANLIERFDVESAGIRFRSAAGNVDLAWGDISSIRLVADLGEALGHRSPLVPKAIHRRAITRLEFTLYDDTALESDQPFLVTLRLTGAFTGGYTHAFRILAGAFAPSTDIADYAPDLQDALRTYASSAYAGARLRQF